MFTQKYMDGTPVEPSYQAMVGRLVSQCAEIVEQVGEDELERYAAEQRANSPALTKFDLI